MPDRNPVLATPVGGSEGRIAVIDVGSNSLRLVVFERLGATLVPLLNEKVMGALGRGIAATGRLNPEGIDLALANLQRFVALARALGVDRPAILATAAVRDASDGAAFAAAAERDCGVPMQIIAGSEEARLSAAGVLAGIREPDGIVADLGGGSVELVRVNAAAKATIGTGVSLPLGPLRLAEFGDNRRAIVETIDRAVGGAPVLRGTAGKSLYLVGGAWRAIARLHMEQSRYPLHIIHEYTIARRAAEGFLDIIAGQSRRSLERITTISRKRLDVVPLAATILRRLLAAGRPERIVFSAFGLREGYAYGLLPDDPGTDPLIAACIGIAESQSRWRTDGDRLQRWVAPAFPGIDDNTRRLHRATCWLSDFAWSEHPDYRAGHAFTRSLTLPVAQIGHRERVYLATALHARYGGPPEDTAKAPTRVLLDDAAANEARCLGLALRLAYTLSGGALELLNLVRLSREPGALVLELPPSGNLFIGEAVQRRLDALARALGITARTERRREPQRALA
ncbi:MAG TPA: Ppx/GppA family phosphatase [Stellaceae bacterium]|jgi:exopolyphosphatase/guanosine-5'-triphosphate,3'-diphosphate pyrophosphatase|nr:Ppx/GppA family phosphatase [Stellaceae bacterium]